MEKSQYFFPYITEMYLGLIVGVFKFFFGKLDILGVMIILIGSGLTFVLTCLPFLIADLFLQPVYWLSHLLSRIFKE